jgi:hypothetical protein
MTKLYSVLSRLVETGKGGTYCGFDNTHGNYHLAVPDGWQRESRTSLKVRRLEIKEFVIILFPTT